MRRGRTRRRLRACPSHRECRHAAPRAPPATSRTPTLSPRDTNPLDTRPTLFRHEVTPVGGAFPRQGQARDPGPRPGTCTGSAPCSTPPPEEASALDRGGLPLDRARPRPRPGRRGHASAGAVAGPRSLHRGWRDARRAPPQCTPWRHLHHQHVPAECTTCPRGPLGAHRPMPPSSSGQDLAPSRRRRQFEPGRGNKLTGPPCTFAGVRNRARANSPRRPVRGMERSPSGRWRRLGKAVGAQNPLAGSNPALSARFSDHSFVHRARSTGWWGARDGSGRPALVRSHRGPPTNAQPSPTSTVRAPPRPVDDRAGRTT